MSTSPPADASNGQNQPLPRWWRPITGHRLGAGQQGSVDIHGEVDEDELPVVLLPGIEGSSHVFARLGGLAEQRTVWALDLPPGRYLLDLGRAVLQAVPARRFVVAGLSFGGLVGRAMVQLQPQRIAGLVTLGSLPHRSFLPAMVSTAGQVLRPCPSAVFSALYRSRIRERLQAEQVERQWSEPLLSHLPDRSVWCDRVAAIREWGLVPGLEVPGLWLRAEEDAEAPWTDADVRLHLPEVGIGVVAGGHRAPLTHPDAFAGAVESFIGELSS